MKLLQKEEYVKGIQNGDKIVLSRAITLLESTKLEHNILARSIIEEILPSTGNSFRIGITGVPGVGKSTFIEAMGELMLADNHKIAILAIDPSSQKSKGSILGDKTRMENLSGVDEVFIRPTPAGSALGGVGRKTRETILLCEAAGFDTIIIETVGVGQSEISVHSMVDCFLLLMLPGAGDELQGIKRGIMEMADILAINKADGERLQLAKNAAAGYKNALHLMPLGKNNWTTPVLTCSAEKNEHLTELWESLMSFKNHQKVGGFFMDKRREQAMLWFQETVQQHLIQHFLGSTEMTEKMAELKQDILAGKTTSFAAADQLIAFAKLN